MTIVLPRIDSLSHQIKRRIRYLSTPPRYRIYGIDEYVWIFNNFGNDFPRFLIHVNINITVSVIQKLIHKSINLLRALMRQ